MTRRASGDWTVGVWSIVMAAVPRRRRPAGAPAGGLPLAVALSVADVGFSAVKFIVYDESAAIPFAVVTLVLFALVGVSTRPWRP